MGFYENHVLPLLMDVALAGLKEDRRELIRQASGNVLEIGMGNGVNLPFYTNSTKQIVGLEPCEARRFRSEGGRPEIGRKTQHRGWAVD